MNPLVEICSYKTFKNTPITNTFGKIKELDQSVTE